MKTASWAALVTATLVVSALGLTAQGTAKFRHVTSVYVDDKGTGLRFPEGVACNDKGQLVVGDTGNDRILRFLYRDETLSGGSEIKVPELSAPLVVQLNSTGDIYALDGKRRRIVQLGADGVLKGTLSFDGVPPPAAVLPKSFRIDTADNLYVLDVVGARVLVLNAEGQFQRAVPLPDDAGFVTDVTVDFTGTVIVIDSLQRQVYAAGKDDTSFTPLGSRLTETLATMPSAITAVQGAIFIAEGRGSTIVSIGRDGSFLARQLLPGWTEGALNHPSQICVNDKDEVFIADRDNSRIQVFGLIR